MQKDNKSMIIGIIIGGIVFILLIIIIILIYKKFKNYQNTEKENYSRNLVYTKNEEQEMNSEIINNSNDILMLNDNIDENPYSKIHKKDYENEFNKIPIKPLRCSEYGRLKENRPKNRFKNITPYDDTRLKIKVINDDPYSDYINATLIPNIDNSNVIATQGPNLESINDFWRMVVENNVCVIVMLCNIKENDKVKCDQYWPLNGSQNYGDVEITLIEELQWLDFIKRIFILKTSGITERKIVQYQFTGWPDHGIPKNVTSLLSLRNLARIDWLNTQSIPVIHCSAGCGRTGCFIAIENMIEAKKTNKELTVFDFVNNMRNYRQQMVQTLEQYKFIYTSLSIQIDLGATIYTPEEFQERFINGKINSEKQLKNQYNTLKNESGKNKKSQILSNSKITNLFSEIIFKYYTKLSPTIWTDEAINTANQYIIIANEQDCSYMLPSNDKSLEIDKLILTLDKSSATDFGFEKVLRKKIEINETYANTHTDIYSNVEENFHTVYQFSIGQSKELTLQNILKIFNNIKGGKYLVPIFSNDDEIACNIIAAIYTIESFQKRQKVCIFPILQQLFQNYKDFQISERNYIDLHKMILDNLNQ